MDEGLVLCFAAPALGDRRGGRRAAVPRLARRSWRALVAAAVRRGARRARPGRVHATGAREREGRPRRGPRGSRCLAAAASRGEARRALGLVRGRALAAGARRCGRSSSALLVGARGACSISPRTSSRAEEAAAALCADRLASRTALLLLAAEAGAGRATAWSRPSSSSGAPNAGKSTLFNALRRRGPGPRHGAAPGRRATPWPRSSRSAGSGSASSTRPGCGRPTERGRAARGRGWRAGGRRRGPRPPRGPGRGWRGAVAGQPAGGVPVLVVETKADLPGRVPRRRAAREREDRRRAGRRSRQEIAARLGGRSRRRASSARFPRQREALLRRRGRARRPRRRRSPAEIAAARGAGGRFTRSERSRARRRRRSSWTGSSRRSASENEGASWDVVVVGRWSRRGRGGLGRCAARMADASPDARPRRRSRG